MKISDELKQDTATSGAALGPGDVLAGQFELEALLGRGGMGEVWRARDRMLDRVVAVKVLPATLSSSRKAFEALRREAAQAIELAHEALVRIHHFGVHLEQPFLVMEYVRGRPLSRVLDQDGTMPLPRALALLVPLAAGLDYAHSRKLVHRDVKPANVLVREPEGSPALVDFGIAAELRDQATRQGLTGEAPTVGTLSYMSPEQVKGKRPAPSMDVYALAAMAYEMLGGDPPFFRGDALAVQHQILHEPPEPLAGLPPAVQEALAKGLAKDPAQRYPSPGELVEALALAAGLPVPPREPRARAGAQSPHALTAPHDPAPAAPPGPGPKPDPRAADTSVHARLASSSPELPPLASDQKALRPASSPGTRIKRPPSAPLPVVVEPAAPPAEAPPAGPPGLAQTLAPVISGGTAAVFAGIPTAFLSVLWMWTLKEYGITGTRRREEGLAFSPAELVLHAAYYITPLYAVLGPLVASIARFVRSLSAELGHALSGSYPLQCAASTALGVGCVLVAPNYGGLDRGEVAGVFAAAAAMLAWQVPPAASLADPAWRLASITLRGAAARAAIEPLVLGAVLAPLVDFAAGELIHTDDPVQQFFLALGFAAAALPASVLLALVARFRLPHADWVPARWGLAAGLLVSLATLLLAVFAKPVTLLIAPVAFLVALPVHLAAMLPFLPSTPAPARELPAP